VGQSLDSSGQVLLSLNCIAKWVCLSKERACFVRKNACCAFGNCRACSTVLVHGPLVLIKHSSPVSYL
jgi:hypothetical protein